MKLRLVHPMIVGGVLLVASAALAGPIQRWYVVSSGGERGTSARYAGN